MKKCKNKKPLIGILSMQRIVNYGSFLQALGLKRMLGELGYDAVFADFSVGKRFSAQNIRNTPIYRTLRRYLSFVKPLPPQPMRDAIASQYGVLGLDNRYRYRRRVDTLILGSDEVFNFIQNEKTVGCSPELLGVNNRAKRCISYAASCGNLTEARLTDRGMTSVFIAAMHRLSAISVRDEQTYALVNKLTGIMPVINADPVLVADFGSLLVDTVSIRDYILVYGYSGRFTSEEGEAIRTLARKRDKKLYSLSEVHPFCDDVIYCKPLEVMAYFQHADLVITETFHGVVFSLLAEKNFAVFVRSGEDGNENKLSSLLRQFDLAGKKVDSVAELETVLERPVDFETVRRIRQSERSKALTYLRIQLCQTEPESCCGCEACVNACPQNAITMEKDACGYRYPRTDSEKCILCGRCIGVCGYRKEPSLSVPKKVFAASCRDQSVTELSASGGVFPVLARVILRKQGTVYGCAFDYADGLAVARHIRVSDQKELWRLSGSKYVQSEIGESYTLAKKDLEAGKAVLFSGTPCQIDGLRSFLGKDYPNLVTIDLVCHGVPSQAMLDGYLTELNRKRGEGLTELRFRSKRASWGDRTGEYTCLGADGTQHRYELQGKNSSYYRMFLQKETLRENCYSCPYAQPKRCGDITLGDYWGIETAHPQFAEMHGKAGISCVLLQTEKGIALFEEGNAELNTVESALQKVSSFNEQLNRPSKAGKHRNILLWLFWNFSYRPVEQYQRLLIQKEKTVQALRQRNKRNG